MNCLKYFILFIALISTSIHAKSRSQDSFHVVTVATRNDPGLQMLLHSCQYNGITIDILGMGDPYLGNGQKLLYMLEYMKDLPNNDIVLFSDGFDTLFLNDKKTILKKFLAMKVPCLFSAEVNCFPEPELCVYFPPSPTKFKYINTGNFIGYVGHLRQIFTNMNPIPNDCDQRQTIRYYVDGHQNEINLDYYCELFFPLHALDRIDFSTRKKTKTVNCLSTGTKPCIVHGNGLSKHFLDDIYKDIYK